MSKMEVKELFGKDFEYNNPYSTVEISVNESILAKDIARNIDYFDKAFTRLEKSAASYLGEDDADKLLDGIHDLIKKVESEMEKQIERMEKIIKDKNITTKIEYDTGFEASFRTQSSLLGQWIKTYHMADDIVRLSDTVMHFNPAMVNSATRRKHLKFYRQMIVTLNKRLSKMLNEAHEEFKKRKNQKQNKNGASKQKVH